MCQTHTCVCGGQRSTSLTFLKHRPFTLVFSDSFSLPGTSLRWHSWPANEHAEPVCLDVLRVGATNTHSHTCRLLCVLGIRPRSLYLHRKSFTNQGNHLNSHNDPRELSKLEVESRGLSLTSDRAYIEKCSWIKRNHEGV